MKRCGMNSRTVAAMLRKEFPGLQFTVTGERARRMRFYSIAIPDRQPAAGDPLCLFHRVKTAVADLITSKGFSGGCDIIQRDKRVY